MGRSHARIDRGFFVRRAPIVRLLCVQYAPHLKPMTEMTSRLTTAFADRYKIERHLSEGGMEAVYLAEDIKHECEPHGE